MNRRALAEWFLSPALAAIMASGFYPGASYREPRPASDVRLA
ncbi:hypothetical protein ACFPME_13935 [Rhodanobacter umsongensis]|uniref:Uncharacterized protein n=1 Tax=Rhodanobacter umsongensis TaxID=633153 RepID=A0ABW0JNJ7_9GAMM